MIPFFVFTVLAIRSVELQKKKNVTTIIISSMPGKYWTINPQECLPIRMGDKGVSAWPARTVGELVSWTQN